MKNELTSIRIKRKNKTDELEKEKEEKRNYQERIIGKEKIGKTH